jgi:NTE family protein
MFNRALRYLLMFCLCVLLGTASQKAEAQSVGIVLSGGGASALAHIGFLRALEENNIPVDYISGTSMGAVIGAMYASGFSIDEIDSLVRSDDFQRMSVGDLDGKYEYYFQERDNDAGLVTLKFSEGSLITNSLPTNVIDPQLLDFNFMAGFSGADAASGYNFDSLYVPFRCIASDIESKKQVLFKNGSLATAVRASSTYPFYVSPIEVDGKLLFDGGLYNNFPSDVMYQNFMPDIIIGCNVSENNEKPSRNDLISQLKNMIVYKTNFEAICEHMFIVAPKSNVSTFSFSLVDESIKSGYDATISQMELIGAAIERKVTMEERTQNRSRFRSKMPPLVFDEIRLKGLERGQGSYVRNLLGGHQSPVPVDKLKPAYFRVYNDDKIRSIYPQARFKPETGFYALVLDVEKEKDVAVTFGGNFSSRPINTGFVGLRYNLFSRFSSSLSANSYFGRFYGSVSLSAKFDFSAGAPFSVEPHVVYNRWDYFRSQSTFFEDVKPSFIVKNEQFTGLNFRFPAGNSGRFESDLRLVKAYDDYYLTQNFVSTDTADQTVFRAGTFSLGFKRNTLNRKVYANAGTYLHVSTRFVEGREQTIPGSTSASRDTVINNHDWVTLRLRYQNYFQKLGNIKLGLLLDGVWSTQPFFNNRIASLMRAPAFEPIPESQTLFMPQFRAHDYAAGGLVGVWSIKKSLDFRAEAHVFQPFGKILSTESGEPVYDNETDRFYIGSASLILHTPIGPASLSANYYDQSIDPWSIMFNFGYILFNRQALE